MGLRLATAFDMSTEDGLWIDVAFRKAIEVMADSEVYLLAVQSPSVIVLRENHNSSGMMLYLY